MNDMERLKLFQKRFKDLLHTKGLNQTQFASLLGTRDTTVGTWYHGRSFPHPTYLVKIADYFDVTTDYLLGRADI